MKRMIGTLVLFVLLALTVFALHSVGDTAHPTKSVGIVSVSHVSE